MKNLLKVFAVAVAIVLAACSKDATEPSVYTGDTQVTFTTTIPGATEGRAIADGSTVDKLYYAVYEHGQTTKLIDGTETISGKTATVNVTLVSGMKYDIVFWAQKEGAPYTFNTTDNCIDIDWTNLVGNNENRDAFIFVRKALEVNGSIQETITLKRPFAQLNIGISDFEAAKAAGFELAETKVSVDSYDQINFFGGEAYSKADGTGDYGMPAGTETPVTFACAAPMTGADETITIKGTAYKYVAMDYILPAMPTDAYDVDITFCTANEAKQYSVPTFAGVTFERNHRTNIMGSLLTDPGKFVIEIDEEFDDPDYTIAEAWDGVETVKPALVNGYYEISSPAHWAWLAKNGVGGNNLKLTSSINFNNHEIKAVAFGNGEFDGQGYTMSNMIPLQTGNYSVGLFNPTVSANANITIKNLTIAGAVIDSYFPDYGYAAVLFGDFQNSATLNLNGVTVKDAKIKGVQSVAAFVGLVASGTTVNIADCSVENSYLTNYSVDNESGFVCGMAGKVVGTVNFTGANTIKDTTIDGLYAARRGDRSIEWAAATYDSTTGTITGANTVTVSGGALNEIPLANYYLVKNGESLNDALAAGATYIIIEDGEYDEGNIVLPANDVRIVGEGGAIIKGTFSAQNSNVKVEIEGVTLTGAPKGSLTAPANIHSNSWWNGATFYIQGGDATYTFKNVTFDQVYNGITSTTNSGGFTNVTLNIEDCYFKANGQRPIQVNGRNGNVGVFETNITNTTFDNFYRYAVKFLGETGDKMTLTNCKFINFGSTGKAMYYGVELGDASNTYSSGASIVNTNNPEAPEAANFVEVFIAKEAGQIVNGKCKASSDTALASALTNGAKEVELTAGTYVLPDVSSGSTFTISGSNAADVIVETQDDGSYEGCDYSFRGCTVTFNNITITTPGTTYTGYAGLNATYNKCIINNTFTLYGDSKFNECTFNVSGDSYNIWTWGAPTAEFTDCVFNTSGKAILLYGNTNTTLKVAGCIFNDANDYDDVNNKAAIEVGSDWTTDKKEIVATGCTVNGFDITNKGLNTGSTLWGNKNSLPTSRLNVVIDNVEVY